MRRALLSLPLSAALAACGPSTPAPIRDREPGERAPLTAKCDPADPVRCALPFPSNTFARAAATARTGLRLAFDGSALTVREDTSLVNHADGFSRASPLLTAFPSAVDPASLGSGDTAALRLYEAQPGEAYGRQVPLRLELATADASQAGEVLLLGYPRRPLAPAADHVALLLDGVRAADGSALSQEHSTQVALGLVAPVGEEEQRYAAYHAPTRALVKQVGVDPRRVLRAWDFTSRSREDARARMLSARAQAQAAVDAGSVTVAWDVVQAPAGGDVALVLEGRLVGLPEFRTADGLLSVNADGVPVPTGTHEAPFRLMVPRGQGNYRMAFFGHGTGGNFHEDQFDAEMSARGLGKVTCTFYGWNDAEVFQTLTRLERMFRGVARSTAGLVQALADLSAVEQALAGPLLGDALSAAQLGGQPNPAAGRRPDLSLATWTGGSLGGTMGLAYTGVSDRIRHAVLNVPGGAWTHFIPGSELYIALRPAMAGGQSSYMDFRMALAMSQGAWDDVDGANWADELAAGEGAALVQQSMGDTVLPNPGSEFAAGAVGATQLGAVLREVPGLPHADEVVGGSGYTQFGAPGTTPLSIHGFAARDGVAGDAAREQIFSFISSVLDGAPRITLPQACRDNTPAGSCDFRTP
jgi:hypothetical protein